jgi:iron-regulated transporter 1
MHFLFAFSSRMWAFGITLFMASLTNNSLFFVALAGFASCLLLSISAPFIGNALDRTDRLVAVRFTLVIKAMAVFMGYLLCGFLAHSKSPEEAVDPTVHPSLYVIPILAAIAQVSFSTVPLCVEKDWVVVLSDGDSSWLSGTNSSLRQIDLACKSVAPAITGFIFSSFTQPQDAVILLTTNMGAVFLLYAFLRNVYQSWEPLQRRKGLTDGSPASLSSSSFSTPKQNGSVYLFMTSGVALPMIAYSFLYLTVLSFGTIMIVYLRFRGMTDHSIGIHSGISALAGFAGSKVYPFLADRWGLWTTALWSIWCQCVLVFIAMATFIEGHHSNASLYVLCYCVILSRAGLWLFDLAVGQIVQEALPENTRGSINGTWRSLYAVFDMMSYVMTMSFSDPEDFFILCLVSATCVACATAAFSLAFVMRAGGHNGKFCGVGVSESSLYELVPDTNIDA